MKHFIFDSYPITNGTTGTLITPQGENMRFTIIHCSKGWFLSTAFVYNLFRYFSVSREDLLNAIGIPDTSGWFPYCPTLNVLKKAIQFLEDSQESLPTSCKKSKLNLHFSKHRNIKLNFKL